MSITSFLISSFQDNLELHSVGFKSHHMHNLTELVLHTLGVHVRIWNVIIIFFWMKRK